MKKSALTLFPKRIAEPKAMGAIEMKAFEDISRQNYKRWFIPLIDDFLKCTSLRSGNILDIACGPGLLSKELGSRNAAFRVIGIDISPAALSLARKNTRGQKNISFTKASVYRLPFKDGAFEAVISKDSVHHFDHISKALSEMLRVLKPGGYLYVQDMRRDLPMYLIQRSVRRSTVIEQLQYYSTRAAYTREEIRPILSKLTDKTIHIRTPRVTPPLAHIYGALGIDITQLREGFQARYILWVRK
jgi:ubiquinone/menaquinone biosynthesis C-methylase UbiE